MSEEEPVQPHQQDDCEDCRKQRAQNNQLINFYERLNKIKTKVSSIKPNLSKFRSNIKNNQSGISNINQRIKNPPYLDFSNYNQKQMGYELAYALIQRQMKMKIQNQILQKKIKQLKQKNDSYTLQNTLKYEKQQREKAKKLQRQKQQKQKQKQKQKIPSSYDGYNDSLDDIKQSKSSFWVQQITPKTYNRKQRKDSKLSNNSKSFSVHPQNSSTSSSFLGGKNNNRNEKEEKKKIEGLNLWLYQMNTQKQEKGLYKTSLDKQKFS